MDKKYERLNITLPKKLLDDFKKFCEANGINLSSRIAILIKEDLQKKNPLKK
ncbi:MAG: CopG family transcriptional regulator [Candidatus Pacearchaeota archaeon]|nr:CopG family transcriptional regulator [Candidatus Pacearchaeota archaeon]